jgi:cell division septation protein DedD
VGVVLIVFVLWWLYLTKSVRDRDQGTAEMADRAAVTDEPSSPAGVTDSLVEEPGRVGEGTTGTVRVPETTGTTGRDAGAPATVEETTRGPGPAERGDIFVAEKLDDFANQYLVHVSSFRRVESARDEAFYLLGWGYPVFIYRVDLGGKGMWYRVYVGPSATREEAAEHKIKLDENPRILSTRIARVPG